MSDTPRTDARLLSMPVLREGRHSLVDVVEIDFARQLERELAAAIYSNDALATEHVKLCDELSAAQAQIAALHERLEDSFYFNDKAERVDVEPGSIPDGISCRNETIKLLDIRIAELEAQLEAAKAANVSAAGAATVLQAQLEASEAATKAYYDALLERNEQLESERKAREELDIAYAEMCKGFDQEIASRKAAESRLAAVESFMDELERASGDAPHRAVDLVSRIKVALAAVFEESAAALIEEERTIFSKALKAIIDYPINGEEAGCLKLIAVDAFTQRTAAAQEHPDRTVSASPVCAGNPPALTAAPYQPIHTAFQEWIDDRNSSAAPVHKNVFEYDGSYKCLDCGSTWGALPGFPVEPLTCMAELKKPTLGQFSQDEINKKAEDLRLRWMLEGMEEAAMMLDELFKGNCYPSQKIRAEIARRKAELGKAI